MHARFLLGPAGSGKTFRCLSEIRSELLRSPEGPPLLLLAPKQATFQLERQLLADPALSGYTRLQIASFDRLAEFTLGEFAATPPRLLDEQGRVMALRALLSREQRQLRVFHATARLPGFAQELSELLRELQRHQISTARLEALSARFPAQPTLARKLHDLTRLATAYRNWLLEHGLEDADSLLDLATAAIHSNGRTPNPPLHAAALWLDGFAEMTPQELDMLAAFLPLCRRATLAFCLEAEPSGDVARLSPWAAVARTFTQCHQRVLAIPDAHVEIEILPRSENAGRFAANTTLRSLESRWSQPPTPPKSEPQNPHLRLVRCADPEAEAVFAAREILRFVREPRHDAGPPNRFRDCAVIVRSLEPYHAALTRIFRRYGIPFFLDRREAVAHHPLAELTRFAVRCAAYDWRSADWFGALKTGLVTPDDDAVDALENEALARGWEGGRFWRQPLPIADDHAHAARLEQLRLRILPPFEQMARALGPQPTGSQIATAVRDLWSALDVETTLERWSDPQLPLSAPGISQSALHQTVFDQTDQWLANVELAFTNETLPLPEWLPVLEAGLAGLSVGVIPPALDQVLIGGIDRSRQPELKLALVLGLNEGVFPAPPATATLLTDAERDLLAGENVQLETDRLQQISRERFYGYIAVTRARERLLLTRADQDSEGRPLNPSPFFTHAGYITGTHEEEFRATPDWWDAEHTTELAADLFQIRNLESLPALAPLVEKHRRLQTINQSTLAAATVRRLYGTELKTSVSALEQFAACPFKYFAARGLKLDERREFEFNARDKGSLQHDVLEEFHKRATANGGSWRKLTPARASDLIAQIGNELLPAFAGGKFQADGAARFTGAHLVARLQRLVTTLIEWMPQYGFDPVAVEVSFDDEHGDLPSWRLDLSDGRALLLRGRIDRVDVCPLPDGTALAVVMDYKSRARELNAAKLHHGLELQLLSYLGVLKQLRDTERIFGAKTLSPAGVFFIPLNGQATTSSNRDDARSTDASARRTGYQHRGRFLGDELARFDNRDQTSGDQFKYSKKRDGTFNARGNDALPRDEFDALRESVESHLHEFGCRIFGGEIAAQPFRIGRETACDYCEFRSVCRFDPWTQPFRSLRPPPKPAKESGQK